MSDPARDLEQLRSYTDHLAETLAETGAQAALWDRDWVEEAQAALEHLARSGATFTADDVREAAGPPPSDGALGGLFLRASRRRLIVCVGFDRARRISRHGSVVRVWRGVRVEGAGEANDDGHQREASGRGIA